MNVESDADRAAFLDIDEFGLAATITIGGSPAAVNGILTTAFAEALADIATGVESEMPIFKCASADVTGVDHNDPITVVDEDDVSTDYIVIGVEPSGDGMTRLLLQEV